MKSWMPAIILMSFLFSSSIVLAWVGLPYETLSEAVEFQDPYSLPAPTLYNIDNNDKNGSYTIRWSSVTGATSYTLQEQKNGGGWTNIYTGSNTSKSVSGKADATWCYRVNASNAIRTSVWSTTKCTTVDTTPAAPGTPTLYKIRNGDKDGNYNVIWSSIASADSYELQEQKNGGSWSTIYTGPSSSRSLNGKTNGNWCYQVRASSAGGNSSWSTTQCTTVDVSPPAPQANFDGSPLSGENPLTVKFLNQSNGIVDSYSWDFGDGRTSNKRNPSHTYKSKGTYTVKLTVTGPGGSDTKTENNYIVVKEGSHGHEIFLPMTIK